ncbi:MAG: 3,4-dihydroxy-2-butanone-4-phosphate synthase, partial [Fusobacteriaceae bacterium]
MLDTIQSALEDLKKGKMIIVVDDENRENEGDIVFLAQ